MWACTRGGGGGGVLWVSCAAGYAYTTSLIKYTHPKIELHQDFRATMVSDALAGDRLIYLQICITKSKRNFSRL